jgi:predicted methyltransferase
LVNSRFLTIQIIKERSKQMSSIIKKISFIACLGLGLSSGAFAIAPDFMDKLGADSRPEADKVRDSARRPYQIMALLGVEEGMTAIDVGAGGGWYTRVLSAAVGPSGRVISQWGPRALGQNNGQAARDMATSLGNTEASFEDMVDIESNVADVAVTALNIHHSNAERGVPYLRGIYDVLKPGGVAVIIDHVGIAGQNNGGMHRVLPASVKQWIESAGFEVVEESNILYTNADDHTVGAQDPRLGRNVDRFAFLIRKPA